MARQYLNPPIVEATFECRFEHSDSWGLAALAAIQGALKDDYPAKERVIVQSGLEVMPLEAGGNVTFRSATQNPRYQFASSDERSLVRVSADALTVHAMAPYLGWKASLKAKVAGALAAYLEIARPAAMTRLSLRYVNRIELGSSSVDLEDYIRIPVEPPTGLNFDLSTFFIRLEATRDPSTTLIQTLGRAPGDQVALVLDLDVVREPPQTTQMSIDQLMREIGEIRRIELDVFEALITEKLRERFDAPTTK